MIFKANLDGSGFIVLHHFSDDSRDGIHPFGSLIFKGSLLVGMTYQGGSFGKGTIFKINMNGTGYAILHSFAGATSDGSFLENSLILKNSILYGTTVNGGASSKGILFSLETTK